MDQLFPQVIMSSSPATLRVGLATARLSPTLDAGVERIQTFLRDAAARHVDVVCFPESYLPGIRCVGYDIPAYDHDVQERAITAIRDAARDAGVARGVTNGGDRALLYIVVVRRDVVADAADAGEVRLREADHVDVPRGGVAEERLDPLDAGVERGAQARGRETDAQRRGGRGHDHLRKELIHSAATAYVTSAADAHFETG